MGWKDYFKLTWPVFILFVIFNYLSSIGFLSLVKLGGKGLGSGIFNLFSFFNQFTCATHWTFLCYIWDPLLLFLVFVLNIIWQFFLANLIMNIYYRLRK